MKKYVHLGLITSLSSYVFLHFITYIFDVRFFLNILAVSGILMFIFTLMLYGIKRFKLPLSLFLISIFILLFTNHLTANNIIIGFMEMRNIIGLLAIVPIIGWVFSEEPYIEAVIKRYESIINTKRRLYFSIISFMQLLSCFLLFSAIPIMYDFVNKILTNQNNINWKNFKSTAILRGFALSTLWLLSSPTFTYSVEVMQASLGLSLLQGFVMVMVGMFLATIFLKFETSEINMPASFSIGIEQQKNKIQNSKSLVSEFTLIFIVFFGFIIFLNLFASLELMVIIPISILMITILFYTIKGKWRLFSMHAKGYFNEESVRISYQLCLMMAAGTLIFSLKNTNFDNWIIGGLEQVQNIIPVINILSIIPIAVLILGLLGLGPLTAMVLLTGILNGMDISYPAEAIVLSLTIGNAISILLSPLVIPVVLLSSTNGMNILHNGVRLNLKYAVTLYIFSQLYLQLIFA